jgi:hypothetical protein
MAQTPTPWYEAKTGNHQGLIISEATGENVAVTYDKRDTGPIVRAVNCHEDLLAACKDAKRILEGSIGDLLTGDSMNDTGAYDLLELLSAAIAKATEVTP